jgi:hypothetical protein
MHDREGGWIETQPPCPIARQRLAVYIVRAAKKVPCPRWTSKRRESLSLALEIASWASLAEFTD